MNRECGLCHGEGEYWVEHAKHMRRCRPCKRAETAPPCTSGKQAFASRAEADAALALTGTNRSYMCDRCGHWHITSGSVRSPKPTWPWVSVDVTPAAPEPAPRWSPEEPISRARRQRWAQLQDEATRENLARPWPWSTRRAA